MFAFDNFNTFDNFETCNNFEIEQFWNWTILIFLIFLTILTLLTFLTMLAMPWLIASGYGISKYSVYLQCWQCFHCLLTLLKQSETIFLMDSEVILKSEKCHHSLHQWDLRDASASKNRKITKTHIREIDKYFWNIEKCSF